MSLASAMKAVFAAALAGFAVAGCASAHSGSSSWRPTGDVLADSQAAQLHAPAKDRVLWQVRGGAAAMRRAQFAEAKSLLDSALLTIGSTSAKDKDARKSRGYFHEESRKTFRGEPYERVMAYYYRGILYWMDGEPDNARACFRSAQIQDSDAENRDYASDYVLLDYLDGLVTAKLGSDGSDAFKRAQAVAKLAIPPVAAPDANALVFVEFGKGPTKYAAGEFGEQLRFREGSSVVREALVRIGSQAVHVGPYDDLTYQATTRGGRVMDHILANKAVFKEGADDFGTAALISGGIIASSSRKHQEVGLGLVAAGVLSKILSSATTPDADTRTWDNLPQYLSFAALKVPPGQHTATIEFLDGNRRVLTNLTRTVTITVPEGSRDVVLFVSDQS